MVAVALPNALTHCKCSQFSPHFLTPANLPMREQELLAHPHCSLSHCFNKDSLCTRTLFSAYAAIKQACFTRNGEKNTFALSTDLLVHFKYLPHQGVSEGVTQLLMC